MSLQRDLETCLEYAEEFEAERDRQIQAQDNIICVNNESERLKNKIWICSKVTTISAILALILLGAIIIYIGRGGLDLLAWLVVAVVASVVAYYIRKKTEEESKKFESQKESMIQKYTAEAEESSRNATRLAKEIYQENLFDIVPACYFSTDAIEFCLARVQMKLANSSTEAILQLENEIKRLQQMELMEQMHNEQLNRLDNIRRAVDINTLVTVIEAEKINSQRNNF